MILVCHNFSSMLWLGQSEFVCGLELVVLESVMSLSMQLHIKVVGM